MAMMTMKRLTHVFLASVVDLNSEVDSVVPAGAVLRPTTHQPELPSLNQREYKDARAVLRSKRQPNLPSLNQHRIKHLAKTANGFGHSAAWAAWKLN